MGDSRNRKRMNNAEDADDKETIGKVTLPFSSMSLSALSSVSGDPEVVAFSGRVSRFIDHAALRKTGRFRWQVLL